MAKQRVNCYLAGCDKCLKAEYLGKNFMGYDMYKCPAYKRKHTKKNARKCEEFRCSKPKLKHEMCRNCTQGK